MNTLYESETARSAHGRRARLLRAALCGVLALVASTGAWAALPSVNLGLTSNNDGKAKPGQLFQVFLSHYRADSFMDAHGRERPVHNALEIVALTPFYGRITGQKLFGAWYGFEMLQPIVAIDPDFRPAVRSGDGLGNLTVNPVVLQWPQTTVFGRPYWHRLALSVQLPTGSYDRNRALNPSSHHLSVNPYYALTWEFADRWEASARLHYLWSGRNRDPNPNLADDWIQPGQAAHANFSVSGAVAERLRAGVSGYWLRQLNDERVDGRKRPNSKERVTAIGPSLQIGAGKSRLLINAYHEFDAANRAEGQRLLVRYFQLF